MNINIILSEDIKEDMSIKTLFETTDHIKKAIFMDDDIEPIQGIIIIEGWASKFYFNPYSFEGYIGSSNIKHRNIIKHLIPVYAYNSTFSI